MKESWSRSAVMRSRTHSFAFSFCRIYPGSARFGLRTSCCCSRNSDNGRWGVWDDRVNSGIQHRRQPSLAFQLVPSSSSPASSPLAFIPFVGVEGISVLQTITWLSQCRDSILLNRLNAALEVTGPITHVSLLISPTGKSGAISSCPLD